MKLILAILLTALFIASASNSLWAHGGSHDAAPPKEEVTLPVLPDAPMDMKGPDAGGIDYGMGESVDNFEMEEVTGSGPLWGDKPPEPTMSEHEGHDMAQMKHVEPAEHEWIPTSKKGYGWAAALTLFSGVLFGFLTLKRPCE